MKDHRHLICMPRPILTMQRTSDHGLYLPRMHAPPSESAGRWWVSFHQTPDMPEALVQGKEKEFLSWFYKCLAYRPSAVKQANTDEFVSRYSAPGDMRAGFEYYRTFPHDAKDNTELAATANLTMPVLVLSGDVYPALGGDLPGSSYVKLYNPYLWLQVCTVSQFRFQDTGFQRSSHSSL